MVGKLRPTLRLAIIGAAATAGCGAGVAPDDGQDEPESLGTTQQELIEPKVDGDVWKRTTNAKHYRGRLAHYVLCAQQPFMLAWTYKNVGTVPWRDVGGQGENPGSDVKLVASHGVPDPLTGRTFLSVFHNKNDYVRADRNAGNCSTMPGCRRTTFNSDGIWSIAPSAPGGYTTSWRLRDFSAYWGAHSKGFGQRAKLKFKVMSCQADQCGCTAWCSNGEKKRPTAGIGADGTNNCASNAKIMCEPWDLVGYYYGRCPGDGPFPEPGVGGSGGTGGVGGSGGDSGSGGWAATGNGGSGSGTGGSGSGTGGSSSGTGGSSSSGEFKCGGVVCPDLPEIPNANPEHCCSASNRCGLKTSYMNGMCIEIPTEEELEENGYGPPPYDEEDYEDPEDFVEPPVEEYRGSGHGEESGCSIGGRDNRLGWLGAAMVAALAGIRRRRRG